MHHKRALWVLGATTVLDVLLGLAYGSSDHIGAWHGLFCSTGYATTDGCDSVPHGWLSYVLAAIMMLTLIPLVGATWALVTTGLTADHIDARHEEMREHVTQAGQPYEDHGGGGE